MKQSIVTIRLNGQPYQMGCDPGSEDRIEQLAKYVDEILQNLKGSHGQIGEARLLAMVSLILADKLNLPDNSKVSDNHSEEIVNLIDKITLEINELASNVIND